MSDEAGFPPGVLNVLTCSRAGATDVGNALMEDERIAKLSFTGSTHVGKVVWTGHLFTELALHYPCVCIMIAPDGWVFRHTETSLTGTRG